MTALLRETISELQREGGETHLSHGSSRTSAGPPHPLFSGSGSGNRATLRSDFQRPGLDAPQSHPLRHPLFPHATPSASASGLALKSGAPCSEVDIQLGCVKLSRFERGVGAAKDKVMDHLCDKTQLKFRFVVPDYSLVLDPDTDVDVAVLKVDTKTAFSDFRTWCMESDTTTIFKVPEGVSDFSDHNQVLAATSFLDVLSNHQGVDFVTALGYQEFLDIAADTVELDSSNMVLSVLQHTTDKALLLRVKQTYDCLPPSQQVVLSSSS